ncbi:hypothetical protein TRFO_27836 [Tritrichomonas foetus]|uniref:Uncharacterized protein n=1 Tax=Tritrichomonas foetus TaxID=1144522 RepID=A0A1J4K071_9EUKA|nr:hypothetical protein TRFO_27836 [Tritrichomonas foetus]|eukprot:OHT04627.1 hypothetical protein TRFO_27836 [Tritrichomonas foetus]
MDLEEQSEATLEKLIHSLSDNVERMTNTFTAKEISIFSGTIPYMKTMLEYRNQREDFLNNLEKMKHKLKPRFFTDELIENCNKLSNISMEIGQSLINFFQKEVERVKTIREKVLLNFSDLELLANNEKTFEDYITEISNALKQYRLAISRISSQTTMSYSLDDLMMMIRSMFLKHSRKMLLNTLYLEFRRFPLTNRYKIIENCFLLTENDFLAYGQKSVPAVPFLLTEIEDLDNQLLRLASRFGINVDFEVEDGQFFLYHCDKKFTMCTTKLCNINQTNINPPTVGPKINKPLNILVDEEQYHNAVLDEQIIQMMKLYNEDNDRVVNQIIKSQASGYNQLVGIKIERTLTNGLLKRKKVLPNDRLFCWFRMRYLYIRYLITAIMSHYNYFEALKQNLYGKKYKWRASQDFPQLLEIIEIETDKVVLFESAQKTYSKLQAAMMSIISHYTLQYESLQPDIPTEGTKIIDKGAMIEQFLELELRYCNSKRSLTQYLYEISNHQSSNDVSYQIFEIIEERPKYRVTLFSSFEVSFKLAIKIMEKRVSIISTLYHVHILHERQISVQLPNTIPMFERPTQINCDRMFRAFDESFPLSPFEIYQNLPLVSKFLKLAEEVALDIAQGIDFKEMQFFDYMHLSVLQKMKEMLTNFTAKGFFPFEYKHYPFSCELSESVFSLIVSPYINDLNYIEDLIDSIPESKRLRFCISYIRFLEITWKTQKLIVTSDLLQKVYLTQSAQAAVSDPRVYVQSFSYIATDELIDVHEQFTNEKILEFALVDYETPDFNYRDKRTLLKYISDFDFKKLQRVHQFQKFHCFILEITGRYNNLYLDNGFLVSHFGLESDLDESGEEEDIDLFLTQADDAREDPGKDAGNSNSNNNAFIRSFLTGTMLYDSQYIVENQKKANSKREYVFLNIKTQKAATRALISAQAKSRKLSDDELYQIYYTEMIDAFSAYAYRLEIASVCRLERQTLLMNAFADAFIIEPTNVVLVNEAGRAQNHFVVPSWIDTLFLVRTAPLPRQAAIFRIVLEQVASLFQILHLVRFEVGLSQKAGKVFETLWENDFHLETATLQRLLNELNRLPGGNEFDVSSKYLESKLYYLIQRMELALYQAYEASFVSVSGNDAQLGPACLNLYSQLTDSPKFVKGLFTSHRFIPDWMNQFMGEYIELNRNEILRQLSIVDHRVDEVLSGHQLHSVLESSQAMVVSLDFIAIALLHMRLKFTLFQLRSGCPYNTIKDPFVFMVKKDYMNGIVEWNEKIVSDALRSIVPKDETSVVVSEKVVPEDIFLQAEIEVCRNICDDFLLHLQIDEMDHLHDLVNTQFSKRVTNLKDDTPDFENRPQLEAPDDINLVFKDHLNTCRFLIVQRLMDGIKKITAGTVIQMDHLENLLQTLSILLSTFTDNSIIQLPQAWHFILKPYLDMAKTGFEEDILLNIFSQSMKERFNYHLKSDTALKLYESLFEINHLDDLVTQRRHQIGAEALEDEELIRNEFDRLLLDLESQKMYLKAQFKKQKDAIYKLVLKRIENAKNVKFEMNKMGYVVDDSFGQIEQEDSVIREEIEKLKIESRKMRIVRCIAGIATKRYYTKRMQSYESDRIGERAKLWETKRDFEAHQSQMLEDLKRAYRKLANDEVEIEILKQQLENEKQSTIQLVHWKALNTKKEEQLKKELQKFDKMDKVNVGRLLTKLSNARDTLDRLIQETEYIDIETERDIKTPMRQSERLRKRILTAKITRSEALKTRTMGRPQTAVAVNSDSLIAQYRDENIQLMSRNDHLQLQIDHLLQTRDQMPKQTISYMSEVVPSSRLKRSKDKGHPPPRAKRSAITRPRTAMTPRKTGALDQLLKSTLH